jgi:hypothetical protein
MLEADCLACQNGDHDSHREWIQKPPPGLIGGARCPCQGECCEKPRKARLIEQAEAIMLRTAPPPQGEAGM